MTLKLYSAEVEKTRQMKSKENQRAKDIRQYLRNVAKALSPEGIANDYYYANQDGRKITRKINASRRRLTVFSVLVLAALALFIGFLLFELAKSVL